MPTKTCENPDWMLDCINCQAQDWEKKERRESHVQLRCRQCNATETYALQKESDGSTCISCQQKTWTIICDDFEEHHHLKLQCDNCDEVASAWFQSREN